MDSKDIAFMKAHFIVFFFLCFVFCVNVTGKLCVFCVNVTGKLYVFCVNVTGKLCVFRVNVTGKFVAARGKDV
jgi:hypothetical protein